MDISLTRRQLLVAGLVPVALAFVPSFLMAQETAATDPRVGERVIGSPDAPVTLVEYAMFSCPHCAAFHRDVYPQIKANFIDTGKVKLVFREVYFNKPALWAAMVARCAPSDRYFGIVDVLFDRQAEWTAAASEQDLVASLFSIGRQAGLSDAEMNACLGDRAFAEGLVADYQEKATADGVEATPTFFINGVKQPNLDYAEFEARLNAALGS